MKKVIYSIALLTAGILAGCETLNPPRPGGTPDFAPTYPTGPNPKEPEYVKGSIFNANNALPLFETPRARHVGDLVTVRLVEKTDGQKTANTRSRKNDEINIENRAFAGRPISLGNGYSLDFDLQAERKFSGESQSIQNNKLSGSISVTVAKVLANGNMLVQGEKWIRINQGKEYVRLSGIIRPQDIRPDNSITSDRLANARIYYGGTGQIANTNAQGWISRILWGPIFPI